MGFQRLDERAKLDRRLGESCPAEYRSTELVNVRDSTFIEGHRWVSLGRKRKAVRARASVHWRR